jgi:hypothetical protein
MHRIELNEATMICQCSTCNRTKNLTVKEFYEMLDISPPICEACDQAMTPIGIGLNLVELSIKYLKRK